VTSYLNKVLNINQGNHTVSKSSAYSDKDDDGVNFSIGKLFSFGGTSGSQSSNSATFSELQEWLLQHNYDVEIQGTIFVPKSLSLKRVNLNILNRQETIFTKSVQMRHVDAPGTLRVTTGSKSPVESEDNKKFRRDMDALTGRLNQLEPRTQQLEGRIGTVEPQLANAVAKGNQLNDQVAALQSLTSQMHIPNCSTHSSDSGALDWANAACPAGKTLSQFHFVGGAGVLNGSNKMHVEYTCC